MQDFPPRNGLPVTSHKCRGRGPDPKKRQALKDWPRATTDKELANFLGYVNFYYSHIGHVTRAGSSLRQPRPKGSGGMSNARMHSKP